MATATTVKIADAIWIAVALLQRESPHGDFSPREIVDRLHRERLSIDAQPSSLNAHISQHCVANRRRSTGRYRMLVATTGARRRLARPDDAHDPERTGKVVPLAADIPAKYHELLEWYADWARTAARRDPLAALADRYRTLWKSSGDRYVRDLREGWE
jgi:hypothetical protein